MPSSISSRSAETTPRGPWVLVEGGLVQSSSAGVQVFDLDCLNADYADAGTVGEIIDLRERAAQADFTRVVLRCDEWIANHPDLVPEDERPEGFVDPYKAEEA